MGWAAFECALAGRREHLPTSEQHPPEVLRRISFEAGGDYGWRISALWTPRETPPPWKIVVVTGAPSWAEYWAPTMAELGPDREMLVVDRPGFAHSEPIHCVPKIKVQAKALMPALEAAPGQKVLLVGQSYGAAIAALMAFESLDQVAGLVLLSAYFGRSGPTARRLIEVGRRVVGLIPRDLRHAVQEAMGQPRQLNPVFKLLNRQPVLITFIHGDEDDFAPVGVARAVADSAFVPARFIEIQGGDHFLNDLPPGQLLACLETAIDPRGSLRQVRPARGAPTERSSSPPERWTVARAVARTHRAAPGGSAR